MTNQPTNQPESLLHCQDRSLPPGTEHIYLNSEAVSEVPQPTCHWQLGNLTGNNDAEDEGDEDADIEEDVKQTLTKTYLVFKATLATCM